MKLNMIKDILEEKGISQTWLAKQLGKSFNTINCYARHKYHPDLDTLFRNSQILQVELRELITTSKERNN